MAINQQSNKQQGTGFTNLQQIMQANQGNKLGQAVGSGIQQTGQQVQQGLQSGQQDFQTQSQANQLGSQSQKQNVEDVLKDPTKATDTDVSNFAKYRAGQYTGPQDISNIDTLKGQAQQAQQQGQQIGSEGGRQALLQKYAAGPGQYNSGQQRLDTLLLGGQGNQQDLKAARRSVSGLTSQVSGAQQAAQQQAQQYGQQAKGFGQQVTQQTGAAEAGVYNPAQQQAEQANIAEKQGLASEQSAAQAAQNNQLSQDALKALGLSEGQRTYGANLGQFIGYTPQNEQATALNIMSQPQFQQYTKLQQLMGETPAAQQQNPYQAGKTTYDQAAAQQAIAANKAIVDPYEQKQATAQRIQDIWNKYNAMPMQKITEGGMAGQWDYGANDRAAQAEIAQFAPGALGGNGAQQQAWSNANLQTANQDLANINAKYGGNVGLYNPNNQ